ncbi:MAG: sulfatase-like hydrolase/transferase [Planctomycetota bacterium]|nr:sulfatase-like hydrolase/transferase [Planctomycetota bacterium]
MSPPGQGACGNAYIRTPAMDALVQGGVSFRSAYCTSPVCTPARVSLVTGRMPHELGVNVNHDRADDAVPTLGHLFRAAGYRTVWAGKTHTPPAGPERSDPAPGFELLPLAEHANRHLGSPGDPVVADAAAEFLTDRANRTGPWLLTVSLQNPHDICYWIMDRERDVIALTPPDDPALLPPLPANFAMDPNEPEFLTICRQRGHYGNEVAWTREWTDIQWRQYLWVYYRLLERVDGQIARLLKALRDTGAAENTLVLHTADHGEGVAAHHSVVKLMPYQEATAIPLTLRWPGRVPAGVTDSKHLVSGMDVLPTLCDYAGVPVPPSVRGRSLRPVIENPHAPGVPLVVSEFQPDPSRMELKGRILWTGRFKYAAFSHGAGREMLFDLHLDPGETKNLAGSTGHANEIERHRKLLAEWARQTKDEFVAPE